MVGRFQVPERFRSGWNDNFPILFVVVFDNGNNRSSNCCIYGRFKSSAQSRAGCQTNTEVNWSCNILRPLIWPRRCVVVSDEDQRWFLQRIVLGANLVCISSRGAFASGRGCLCSRFVGRRLPPRTIKGFHIAKGGSWAWFWRFDGRASNLVRIYEAPVRLL